MNTIGKYFAFTSFGESHGPCIGGVVDGMPSGITIDEESLQKFMARRKGNRGDSTSTSRNEPDKVEFLSGIFRGKTLGTPIAFIIKNTDCREEDYAPMETIWRPSHADYTYEEKYGIRDFRGGGRASARETATRTVAGWLASLVLDKLGIKIEANVASVGECTGPEEEMKRYAEEIAKAGDSIGGVVKCVISGLPVGIGEPVYDKLQASLANAMMSIPAAKGFDYGTGFRLTNLKGSDLNDAFRFDISSGKVKPSTNKSGGILGGISTGLPVIFRVAFKPVPSIALPQETCDRSGKEILYAVRGRHDRCVLWRVLPVVESMAAITVLNQYMAFRAMKLA